MTARARRFALGGTVALVTLTGRAWAPPPSVTWTQTMRGGVYSEAFAGASVTLHLRCFVHPIGHSCAGRYRCAKRGSSDPPPVPCNVARGRVSVEFESLYGRYPELDAGRAELAIALLRTELPTGESCRFDGYTQQPAFAFPAAIGRYTCTAADGTRAEDGNVSFVVESRSPAHRVQP